MTSLEGRSETLAQIFDEFEKISGLMDRYMQEEWGAIQDLSYEDDSDTIRALIEHLERVKSIKQDARLVFKKFVMEVDLKNSRIEDKKYIFSNKNVTERTQWKITDDMVKVITERNDGVPYSNVIPLSIFKDIVLTALQLIEEKGSVKTGDVTQELKDKIVSSSDYKKTPRIPVYASFKVLLKEGMLRVNETNSKEYLLNRQAKEIKEWVNALS